MLQSALVEIIQANSELFESLPDWLDEQHFLGQLCDAVFVFFDTALFHVAQIVDFLLAVLELLSQLVQHEVDELLFYKRAAFRRLGVRRKI